MGRPILIGDLLVTLKKTYSDLQLDELFLVMWGLGVDMKKSRHLEIIPEEDIQQQAKELALEMSGMKVLPWCLKIDTEAVIESCFAKVSIFGKTHYMFASLYRPAVVEVNITADGVKTGGVMAG